MPHPRKIAVLLWAGPAAVVWLVAQPFMLGLACPSCGSFIELGNANPYLRNALVVPHGILLLAAALGIWFALRTLVGRRIPIASIRHMPFAEWRLRRDELLPLAAGLTIALPGLRYLFPGAFVTLNPLGIAGVFSGVLVAWALGDVAVSRGMKLYQVATSIVLGVGILLAQGFAMGPLYTATGIVYGVWLCLTPIWLASLMRQGPARAVLAESSSR